jgi:hypothetical protein
MAETLGMLCDKLTIVKLKQYHSDDPEKQANLAEQAGALQLEIDEYFSDAILGRIDPTKLTFAANKVYHSSGNEIREIKGNIGQLIGELANVNCLLWHEQEKVYEFSKVPAGEKDAVVKNLAVLNLERNRCIDTINQQFKDLILNSKK